MTRDVREPLLAHIAARSAHRGRPSTVLDLVGPEDFLVELRELAVGGGT